MTGRVVGFLLGAVKILLVAQAPQATVLGEVRDETTGAPLVGAIVTLDDLNRATATGANGRYALRLVPAGPQHISVRFFGHTLRTLQALVPETGQIEINVSLRPVPFPLTPIEVRPSVAVRGVGGGARTGFPDRWSSSAAVQNHPLLAEPDLFQALGGAEVVLKPEAASGVHLRGGDSDQTGYALDGIPVLSPYHTAGVFSAWNPDAISELHVSSATPSLTHPATLSGTIEAATRSPGARLSAQGSVSTTQTRLTLDGPLGVAGAGYLVSMRYGLPGVMAPKQEDSYQRGGTSDWLAKLEVPALGGRVRLLGYNSNNAINTAAAARQDNGFNRPPGRNVFAWQSRSMGAEWSGVFSNTALRIQSWSAAGDASAMWAALAGQVEMAAARLDQGLLVTAERSSTAATSLVGLRLERSRTSYLIESDSSAGPSWRLSARTPVATLFAQRASLISRQLEVTIGASAAAAERDLYLAPRAQLQWKLSEQLSLSASYNRQHQFAQSLRNAESVVGTVFPADLYIGAGAAGVPVARSDQGVLAADYHSSAGVRLGIQAYERGFARLLEVAPRNGGPFTTGEFVVGSGTSRGISIDGAVSSQHYGAVASYGLQRVRRVYGDSSYVPDHGAAHLFEGGVIVFPTATFSVRLGATGAVGRRTTSVAGDFEWESCNLLDQGCEFRGSPHSDRAQLGGTALPPYFRVDVGLRKQWRVGMGKRDASVALFGTMTNVFNRKNVLTYARNPSTGQLVAIDLRPRAPLVVGLDWRF